MNPDATNTTRPLEELERLETHLRGSGPPPFTSNRHLFLDAMNHRRVADAAGDVALRDLLQNRAASLYDSAVSEVSSPNPAVASSTPIVRPLPVSLGEQLARENAAAGPAAPRPSHTTVANHAAPVPVSTTDQGILAQAEASARKMVPGFTMDGYRAAPTAAAPLVSGAPELHASPNTASAVGSVPLAPAATGPSPAGPIGPALPIPPSLHDQLSSCAHISAASMGTVTTPAITGTLSATANADLISSLKPLVRDAAVRIGAAQMKLTEADHELQAVLNNLVHLARLISGASMPPDTAGSPLASPARMSPPK